MRFHFEKKKETEWNGFSLEKGIEKKLLKGDQKEFRESKFSFFNSKSFSNFPRNCASSSLLPQKNVDR